MGIMVPPGVALVWVPSVDSGVSSHLAIGSCSPHSTHCFTRANDKLINLVRSHKFISTTDNVESAGVRPSGDSISNIPQMLEGWHHRSFSAQMEYAKEITPVHRKSMTMSTGPGRSKSAGGLGHQRARSFVQAADGSITAMSE